MRPLLASLVVTSIACTASAGVTHVPGDVPTILEAADLAVAGDSILVAPGTWTDLDSRVVIIDGLPWLITSAAFPRGGVTILGEEGAVATVIDGSAGGPGLLDMIFFFEQAGGGPLVLDGLTLTGAQGTAACAVLGDASDVIVARNCRFVDNQNTGYKAAAITTNACNVNVAGCEFRQNESNYPAIFVLDGNVKVANCQFVENTGGCIEAAGYIPHITVEVTGSEFRDNRGRGRGVAIDTYGNNWFTIDHCSFVRNTATEFEGGAVRVSEGHGTIEYCVFAYDSSLVSSGGAVHWHTCEGEVRKNTFIGSHSHFAGAAFTGHNGTVRFAGNIVTGSTGSEAVRAVGTGVVTTYGCNDYWDNHAGDFYQWTPLANDIFEDPLFCGMEDGDYTLAENSPCVLGNTPGCGQMGAFGVGCQGVSVQPTSWGLIKSLYREGGR